MILLHGPFKELYHASGPDAHESKSPLQAEAKLDWEFNSDEQAINHLLRCYFREINPTFLFPNTYPESLRAFIEAQQGIFLGVALPHISVNLLVAAAPQPSLTGVHEYLGRTYYQKADEEVWTRLTTPLLADFIYKELNHLYQAHNESDFLVHIEDSLRVSKSILKRNAQHGEFNPTDSMTLAQATFIESEQSLVFGHPYHPSPKSRLGFTQSEIQSYSPEFKAHFQLDYFLIRKEFLMQESRLEEKGDEVTRRFAPQEFAIDPDFAVLPAHPWQAKYLLSLPVVQDALKQDQLRYLGTGGMPYHATSSVRTLFAPQNPYFYKLSLNVRITNCIRRNALHELQGSIAVSRIIASIQDDFKSRYPHFQVLDEPTFMTANFSPQDQEPNLVVTDGFGLLFRNAFEPNLPKDTSIFLAGSLFGNQSLGRNLISEVLHPDRLTWFHQYLQLLIPPFFELFFEEGVLFEAHLQNALVGLQNGMPTRIWIRDFDNARIIAGTRSEEKLQSAPARVIREFTYSPTQGWKRFIYCLIVNHLCEAIYHLAFNQPKLEAQLWDVLKHTLLQQTSRSSKSEVKNLIETLVQGRTLPAKANLLTRFTRTTDCQASYIGIPNPMGNREGVFH